MVHCFVLEFIPQIVAPEPASITGIQPTTVFLMHSRFFGRLSGVFRGVSAVGLRFFGLVHLFEVARAHAELFVEQPAGFDGR